MRYITYFALFSLRLNENLYLCITKKQHLKDET